MSNAKTKHFKFFRLSSLKQRYLATTVVISAALFLVSYFGWTYVEDVSKFQLQHVEHRSSAEDALADLISQIHAVETSLQRFITFPADKNNNHIKRSFELFDASLHRLRNNDWLNKDPALKDLLVSLHSDRDRLHDEVNELVEVRLDETKWFPAMDIMQESMLSHNMQFIAALDLLLMDQDNELEKIERFELYKLLSELRYSWHMLISEFRLYIANSFGVFSSNTTDGMSNRKFNVNLYLDKIDEQLLLLEGYGKDGRLDELNNRSVSELRLSFNEWKAAHVEVKQLLQGEFWRHDFALMANNVEPLLIRIKQRSSTLKLELSVASAKNITDMTSLAKDLSNFVIMLAVIFSIIGLFGYFVFHRSILGPIQTFALALKSDVNDEKTDSSRLMLSRAAEFENLMTAFQDMKNQIKTRQSHLDHMAHHDALTQLPNRILLRDRLELAVARSRRSETMVGLMFLDLDRFKQINDSLGHDVGDELLIQVANRLLDCTRSTDTVSRMGGDEFAIMLEGLTHADQVANMARKILAAFELPFYVGNNELHSSTSIGIALGPNDSNDVDALIKDADIAMYHAKDLGRNNFKFYSADMAAEVAEHMVLENQLRHALESNGFFLLYQPIVDLKSGDIVGTEALLRWQHPEKGILGPDQFLSILEDSGLIRPITQWVLHEASKQYNEFRLAGFPKVRMSINLSAVLLKGDSILDVVINVIEQTKVDPNGLTMEITEDTLLEDLQGSAKALNTLKDMGIRIALDDFGTGQSSLSHLRLDSIDIVKIDREFVRDIPGDQSDSDLVDAVIAMAHRLHMKVVAEGVETQEQLDFLRWRKCDAIQGYYYSKPCTSKEILMLLQSGNGIASA